MAPPVLDTYAALVSTFGTFLTVAIHTILFERSIYPETTFLTARKYNFPVRQNRHPKVCSWINDAVTAVETELLKGTVSRVAVVIYSPSAKPLERFLFDVSSFPSVPPSENLTPFEEEDPSSGGGGAADENEAGGGGGSSSSSSSVVTNPVDLEEQFRGVMSRLAYCGSSLGKLPDGCSFTVCIELKEKAEPPIGHPQPWIPSQPSLQQPSKDVASDTGTGRGRNLGGVKTIPVRSVEAGAFVLELWIEEGKEKQKLQESSEGSAT